MNQATIQETLRLWQAEPDKAKLKPTVTGRSEGSQAILETGSFSWRADLPASLGGRNEGPTPTALLLSALAGCAVTFIRDTLAPQLGVQITGVHAIAQCEYDARSLLGMEGARSEFQNLQLAIQIRSTDTPENVQKLYQTWRERCPIYLALVQPLAVSTSLEIKGM